MAGLSPSEEAQIAANEARGLRAALDIALRGLAAARDAGFTDANRVIAEVNEAIVAKPIVPKPLSLGAWLKGLLGR